MHLLALKSFAFLSECGRDGTKYDIVFMYEDSNTLTQESFQDQMEFFKQLTSGIYVGVNDANIAAVKASGSSSPGEILFNLTDYYSSGGVGSALDGETFTGRYSYYQYSYGLRTAYNTALMDQKRNDSVGVVIAVTADVQSYYQYSYLPNYVDEARHNGTKLIVLGLNIDVDNLVTDSAYGFRVSNSSDLMNLVPNVLNILCPCK